MCLRLSSALCETHREKVGFPAMRFPATSNHIGEAKKLCFKKLRCSKKEVSVKSRDYAWTGAFTAYPVAPSCRPYAVLKYLGQEGVDFAVYSHCGSEILSSL